MKQGTFRKLSRVQQAHDEVGVTDIRYPAALCFAGSWLLILFAVFTVDHIVEWRQQENEPGPIPLRSLAVLEEIPESIRAVIADPLSVPAWIGANRRLLERIRKTEEDIEEQGAIAAWIRPLAQGILLFSGVGNEKVYPGSSAWLFYRPGVDSVTGPGFLEEDQLLKRSESFEEWQKAIQPDPLAALIDFQQQLAARGIALLVVPVPVKAEIAPDKFSSRFLPGQLVRNVSYQLFLNQLEEAEVWVADVAKWVVEYETEKGESAFLRTDTHWTPQAMQWVSHRLAAELNDRVTWGRPVGITTERQKASVSNQGDIAAMLDLPSTSNRYPEQTVTIDRVQRRDGSLWHVDNGAELLVLGDSFSNIYSLEAMGWGESAGMVEQLSHFLQQPVDRIIRNDQGAFATRQFLARELARGRDRLAGKKVLLYQFATRELSFGDWQLIPLELQQPAPSDFLHIDSGKELQVHGTVLEVSAVPRPGSVPYRDHVVSIHLVDVTLGEGEQSLSQAVVFMRSMTNNVWSRAARIRPGDELDLIVGNWSDVADALEGLNRSELHDLDLQLQEPVWGKWQEEYNE